jgi:hypothetical protein
MLSFFTFFVESTCDWHELMAVTNRFLRFA